VHHKVTCVTSPNSYLGVRMSFNEDQTLSVYAKLLYPLFCGESLMIVCWDTWDISMHFPESNSTFCFYTNRIWVQNLGSVLYFS